MKPPRLHSAKQDMGRQTECELAQEKPPLAVDTALTLKATGVTLLGVLVSIGVTVALGMSADWWMRALAGAGVTLALAVLVKFGSASRRGPLTRLANWMTGAPDV